LSTLLDDIEKGALDPSTDLPTVLRMCVALGGRSGSTELREWAVRELKGYEDGQELPAYRVVPATIQLDAFVSGGHITGQTISPSALLPPADKNIKEEVPLYQPIAELAALAAAGEAVKLSLPLASTMVALMNHQRQQAGQFEHIERVYWTVAAVSFVGIVDTVRTNLTELVAEIRSGLTSPSAEPTTALADQAVSIVIHGDRNRISGINLDQSSKDATPESAPRRLMYWIVGIAIIIGAIAGVAVWHPWSH
jgi:AbiTii